MALKKADNFNGLDIASVYIRVWTFQPERTPSVLTDEDDNTTEVWEERTRIHCKWYTWDGTTVPSKMATYYKESVHVVDEILTGTADTPNNAFKLAYDALKTLDEFSTVLDA